MLENESLYRKITLIIQKPFSLKDKNWSETEKVEKIELISKIMKLEACIEL